MKTREDLQGAAERALDDQAHSVCSIGTDDSWCPECDAILCARAVLVALDKIREWTTAPSGEEIVALGFALEDAMLHGKGDS